MWQSSGPGLSPGGPTPAPQMELAREAAFNWLCVVLYMSTLFCDTASQEGETAWALMPCLKFYASDKSFSTLL